MTSRSGVDLLPLGSVFRTGGEKLLMVVARAVVVDVEGGPFLFDYGACGFPEGMIGDSMLFCNHEDLVEVVHEGFRGGSDASWLDAIAKAGASVAVATIGRSDPIWHIPLP